MNLSPEIIKMREALLERIGDKSLKEVAQIVNEILLNETDSTNRLAALAARVKVLRNYINKNYDIKNKPKKAELNNVKEINQPTKEAIDNINKDEDEEWVRVEMLKSGVVNGVRFPEGVVIDVNKNDAEKLATNAVDSQFTLTDGTTGFSALHYYTKSNSIFTNLNLPTITSTDAGKFLRVNSGLTGYEFTSPPTENAVFYGLKKDEAGTATYGTMKQDNSVIGSADTFTLSDYDSYFFATAGVGFAVNASGHLTISTP